jgi:hypothetical protein
MPKKKLSGAQKQRISGMAEEMAQSSFKRNSKFKGNRKSQIFAITTAKEKKRSA